MSSAALTLAPVPRAANSSLGNQAGLALLSACIVFNYATFRAVDPYALTIDWQAALRVVLCAACAAYALLNLHHAVGRITRFPMAWLFLFVVWAGLTLPAAISPGYAVAACATLGTSALFTAVLVERVPGELIVRAIIGTIALLAIVCWIAQFVRPDIANVDELFADIEPIRWRLGGVMHPNGLGAHCALGVGMLFVGRKTWKWRWQPIVWLAALFVTTLIATGSRTASMMLIAAAAFFAVRRAPMLLALAAACIAVGVFFGELVGFEWSRWLTTNVSRRGTMQEIVTFTGRTDLWAIALDHIAASPVWGYGFGCSRFIFLDLAIFPAQHPHNMFLDTLVETGIVGGLIEAAMVVALVRRMIWRPSPFPDMILLLVAVMGTAEVPVFNPLPEVFTLSWMLALAWRREEPVCAESNSVSCEVDLAVRPRERKISGPKSNELGSPFFANAAGKHRTLTVAGQKLPAHVVLLTNFIPPYRLPVYTELARRVEKLTILLSTPMEPNRAWQAAWGELDVRLQHTWTVRRTWRHKAGFTDTLHVHVPIDTVGQLRALRPDVIVAAELGFRSLFSGVYARYLRQTPLVLWLTLSDHTEQNRGRLRQVLRRWLLARADAVVVNGASGERYIERFGVDRRHTFRVPYTALPGLFGQLPITRPSAAARRLVYVGQLIERKGLAPFIAALAAWAKAHPAEQVHFDIAGSGPLRQELASLATPANLTLHFWGERDYSALADVYALGDIFVFPTLADEWGLVVNEAMSAGLPVLGSIFSQAVEELCRDGENGWTFRPDSPSEMMAAIDRALSTPNEQLDGMRVAARSSVEHLTPEYAVRHLLQAVTFALNERRKRPCRERPS